MTYKKVSLTVDNNSIELDVRAVLGHLALGLALYLIFGFWPLVVFGLFALAGNLLGWEGCFGEADEETPKRKRKNSEILAEEPLND